MARFVWGRRAICVLFRSLGLRSACNIFVVRVARSHWDLFFLFFYLSSVSMGEKPVKISKHCFVGFACASWGRCACAAHTCARVCLCLGVLGQCKIRCVYWLVVWPKDEAFQTRLFREHVRLHKLFRCNSVTFSNGVPSCARAILMKDGSFGIFPVYFQHCL